MGHVKLLTMLCLMCAATLAAEQADVVVVAANPAGVAASVAAARFGLNVVVLEDSTHVGDIVGTWQRDTALFWER